MVLGVGRVGVDLALFLEHETGGFGQADHVVLGQVAGGLHLGQGLARRGAVFDHAQHAARRQHVVKGLEHRRFIAGHHPVVHVAESQHHVGRARLADHRRLRVDLDQGGFAVDVRARRQLVAQLGVGFGVVVLGAFVARLRRIVDDADVAALLARQRGQDFGVPAAARGDLDDGLAGADAEEGQGFARVAPGVAGHVVGVAPVTGQDRVHRVDLGVAVGGFGGVGGRGFRGGFRRGGRLLGRRAAGGQAQGKGESEGKGGASGSHGGAPGHENEPGGYHAGPLSPCNGAAGAER